MKLLVTLRQRMTEDMRIRNLALNTQTSYLQQVSLFGPFPTSPLLDDAAGFPVFP